MPSGRPVHVIFTDMLRLIRNRPGPARLTLTLVGLAISVGLSTSLLAFADGYQTNLRRRPGPGRHPADAGPARLPLRRRRARRAGRRPRSRRALAAVRRDPAWRCGADADGAFPVPEQKRTDLWVGVDDSMRALKPWWRLIAGFALVRAVRTRARLARRRRTRRCAPPATASTAPPAAAPASACVVAGILEPTGTSDDNLFFLPLATAQQVFRRAGPPLRGRGTAERSRPALSGAAARFQKLPGVEVVTMTEMMGAFLTCRLGAARLVAASSSWRWRSAA